MQDNNLNKNVIDLTGERFYKLLVIGFDHKKCVEYKNRRKRVTYFWRCKCDCGNEVIRSGNSLRGGYTKSCGCNQVRENKLTPLECWRLMGFDDKDFEKAKNIPTSDTQLYKQAGNSIVVNVLEGIFKELLKIE